MGNFEFDKYCSPAQLYLVIGTIGIIVGFFIHFKLETLLTKALFLVLWAWVLNWLCSKGYKAISWILVLLPYILIAFMFLFVKDVMKEGAANCTTNKAGKKTCTTTKPKTQTTNSFLSSSVASVLGR